MLFRRIKNIGLSIAVLSGVIFGLQPFALAATSPDEIKELQSDIQNRQAQINQINKQLDEYRAKIAEYSKLAGSLQNDVALLENEIALAELDVAATQNEIEYTNLQLQLLDSEITDTDTKLANEKEMLSELLFTLYEQESSSNFLELVLGAKSFQEIFSAATQLESVNSELRSTLATTKLTRQNLETQRGKRENKLASLTELQTELQTKIDQLDSAKNAKTVLALQSQDSEVEYRLLLSKLRQEQQSIANEINSLQETIANKLSDADDGSVTVMSWPLYGRITTTFHDTTYPFRYLFEHSGLDIAVAKGTPVQSSAPGIVAWARTGTQYGNYIMIIHANGFATLYAHLSRMDVVADQYVERGQVIGLSGGRPGDQGSGLSTGPHLHYEIRSDGFPVDPMNYLTY